MCPGRMVALPPWLSGPRPVRRSCSAAGPVAGAAPSLREDGVLPGLVETRSVDVSLMLGDTGCHRQKWRRGWGPGDAWAEAAPVRPTETQARRGPDWRAMQPVSSRVGPRPQAYAPRSFTSGAGGLLEPWSDLKSPLRKSVCTTLLSSRLWGRSPFLPSTCCSDLSVCLWL